MNLSKIPAEFFGGPYDGHRFACFPYKGAFTDPRGKYIRGDEKTPGGRVIFRWVFKQKGGSA